MIIDNISKLEKYASVLPGLKTVAEILPTLSVDTPDGRYTTDNPSVRYMLFSYDTELESVGKAEYHKKEIDVQIILSGKEIMEMSCNQNDEVIAEYKEDTEAAFIANKGIIRYVAEPGNFAVFFPGEPHATSIIADCGKCSIKKAVFKILA